ncbi:MBL fold metallo-hydrolase [Dictyobacter aurantiacus]|uniref:MBL fold metallo-hydrolase n=1 Tax=Dictyobacter aurantiacus TaxID=1936993 RepID=A0A401ZT10_9CHLR|nr:MBL fold metallo-hydrolase [Dictyobacter aurantiacus]GCE09920.1 MBL fold metallo-hydrolase [Dictyobacter aurantiacus]
MSEWPEQKTREIADGIFAIIHGNGEMGVSNASFIVEQGHALVVDTMTFPEMAMQMAREIKRQGANVELVVNTHHHVDHVGGNAVFSQARILAHPRSIQAGRQLGLPTSTYDHLMPRFKGRFADLKLVEQEPLPDHLVVPRDGQILSFSPAHTATDLAVWFPTARVLITGDIGFKGVVPLALNGLISGWIEALDALIALDPVVVVPGHGALGTRADLEILRDYFLSLEQLGREAVLANQSLRDALAAFDPGPLTEWLESERHAINLERAMKEARGEINRSDLTAALLSRPLE